MKKLFIFALIIGFCILGRSESKGCIVAISKRGYTERQCALFLFMEPEIWKPIVGWEKYYEVSNLGRVRSLHIRKSKNPIMPIFSNVQRGYMQVLLQANKYRKTYKVHRLVATAFIPNSENKPQVNHINGNKIDNRADNLEWCTNSENQIHAYIHGLKKPFTELTHPGNISVYQYDINGIFIAKYISATVAARKNNFCRSKITECCNGNRKTSNGFIWSKKYPLC